MLLKLDGNSEHMAHILSKISLIRKLFRFDDSFDVTKMLLTNRNNWFIPYVHTVFWAAILSKCHCLVVISLIFSVSLCRGFFMLLFLWTVCYSTINSNKAIKNSITDLIALWNTNVYTLSVCLFVGVFLCCCFYGQFAIVP